MKEKFLKINVERDAIETFVYNELNKEAGYLSGGEVQRLARILANKFCNEWKDKAEKRLSHYNNMLIDGGDVPFKKVIGKVDPSI